MLSAMSQFFTVRELNINNDIDEKHFVRCTYCERSKVEVPCSCFFRVVRDSKIPFDKIMDVVMFDVRYLKLSHAKYGYDDEDIVNMLYNEQAVSDWNSS